MPMETQNLNGAAKALLPAAIGAVLVLIIVFALHFTSQNEKQEIKARESWCMRLAERFAQGEIELHQYLGTNCPALLLESPR